MGRRRGRHVVVFLVLVAVGASVSVMMGRRVRHWVGVHVDGRWILGCSPWFVRLDVSPESVFVRHVVHVSVDPVRVLVPVRAFDLVVTQALLVPVLVVAVTVVHVVPEAVWMVLVVMVAADHQDWQQHDSDRRQERQLVLLSVR